MGKAGVVDGDIIAQRVIISGNFKGSIDSDCIEIMPNGRVEGTITCSELYIEKKGIFIGESKIKTKSPNKEVKD